MRKMLLPLMVLAFVLTTASCARCVTCRNDDQWQKICDKDSNKEDVDDAVDFWEALGWECRASSQVY